MAQPRPFISVGLAALYRKKPDEVRFIARIQNEVFGYTENAEEYILRLTPETHRCTEQVIAEIEWVNYLLGQGVPASQPVASVTGNFCTAVEQDGMRYTAVAFKRAPGEIGSEQNWIPPGFSTMGAFDRTDAQTDPRISAKSSAPSPLGAAIPQSYS